MHARARSERTNSAWASRRFAANILPIIHELQAHGITSYKAMARALNVRGIPTANRRQWHDTTVRNLLKRTSGCH